MKKLNNACGNKLFFNSTVCKRRALASVITSAIILSAVSILGVAMLGWSQTNLASQQQEIEEVFSSQMNKINEDLIFSNIWFPTSSGVMTENHLNITLSNIGILGLNVTSIIVTNVTGTNNTSIPYAYTDAGIIKSGSFSTNVTYQWQSGDELDILVHTARGNQFITQVVAP